jgi:hypothetical protein
MVMVMVEIVEKMGWQRHTVRGFMADAMKKAGYTVESYKPEGPRAASAPTESTCSIASLLPPCPPG